MAKDWSIDGVWPAIVPMAMSARAQSFRIGILCQERMLQTYSISAEGLRSLVWRSARLSFALTVLLIAIFMRMPLLTGEESTRTTSWVLGYLFCVLVIGTWLSTRSTKKLWSSYRV